MPVLLVENGSCKGRRISLDPPGPYCIGRDQSIEICLPDPMVSRRHCVIEIQKKTYTIRDMGSANGTILNNKKVERRQLRLGDRIQAGETLLTFLGDDSSDPLLGIKLRGYEILERVGRGGMGTVYRALQISLDRVVALKVLSPEMVEDPSFVAKFLDEARAAARLSHPNIVMVYDIDDEVLNGQHLVYYSMEYMAGGSVEDLLNRKGPLDPEHALRIALETAQGLQYAEQVGLVHRDIKPGNLMIHESGMIKIGDLGIATRATEEGSMASQRGGICGSPHYISPEQAQGEDLDSRADLYSLGASIFQMLVGRPPFFSTNLKELLLKQINQPAPDLAGILPDLPEKIPPLVAKLLEKNRDRRYLNPRQAISAITEILDEIRSPPPPPPSRQTRFLKTALISLTALVILLGFVAGGSLAVMKYLRHRSEWQQKNERYQIWLEDARAALAAKLVGKVEDEIEKLDAEFQLERDFPEVAKDLEALRWQLSELRAEQARERRDMEGSEALSFLREEMPELDQVISVSELEELIQPLQEFQKKYGDTSSAGAAQKEIRRVEEAISALKLKLRRSESALRSLFITAQAFLESEPPRFREALEKLRNPPPEIKGTPQDKRLQERIEEITALMAVEADRWAREAMEKAATGRIGEALRELQWCRNRVEGLALSVIDEAIKKISSNQEPPEKNTYETGSGTDSDRNF